MNQFCSRLKTRLFDVAYTCTHDCLGCKSPRVIHVNVQNTTRYGTPSPNRNDWEYLLTFTIIVYANWQRKTNRHFTHKHTDLQSMASWSTAITWTLCTFCHYTCTLHTLLTLLVLPSSVGETVSVSDATYERYTGHRCRPTMRSNFREFSHGENFSENCCEKSR